MYGFLPSHGTSSLVVQAAQAVQAVVVAAVVDGHLEDAPVTAHISALDG